MKANIFCKIFSERKIQKQMKKKENQRIRRLRETLGIKPANKFSIT